MSPLISGRELLAELEAKRALCIVDCRFSLIDKDKGERDYQVAHIPGAVYAHLERDLSAPHEQGKTGRHPLPRIETLIDTLQGWGIGNDTSVVAYDDVGGAFAARMWWLLHYLGHQRVQVLDGGMGAFVEAGGTLTDEPTTSSARRFVADIQEKMRATTREVLERTQSARPLLFDARSSDRFRGENETIDPVPGHIPGARSLPFSEDLDGANFLPAAELRQRFLRAVGHDDEVAEAIVYCGSGVTACHLVLAAAHAGLPMPRLYPESYSEWICDPSRTVSRDG